MQLPNRFLSTLGSLPGRDEGVDSRVLGTEYRPNYVMKKVEIYSPLPEYIPADLFKFGVRGRDYLNAYLLEPTTPLPARPLVIAFHIDASEKQIGKSRLVHRGFTLQALMREPYNFGHGLAEAGFTVLVADALGYEERRLFSVDDPTGGVGFINLERGLSMHGDSYLRLFLSDVVRLVNFAEGEGFAHIGAMGFSFGGFATLYSMAFEPRVAGGVAFGCASPIADKWAAGVKLDALQSAHGILNHGDLAEVVQAIAPRPLFMGQGVEDKYARNPQPVFLQAEPAWQNAGRAEAIKMYTYAEVNGHALSKQMVHDGIIFLEKALT